MNNFIIKVFLLFSSLFKNLILNKKVYYLIDYYNWANYNDAENLKKYFKHDLAITRSFLGLKNTIIHVGTLYNLFKNKKFIKINDNNKILLFWPHLNKNLLISKLIKKNINKISRINTCCLQTVNDLVKFGIDKKKIFYIPLSIDLKVFKLKKKSIISKIKKKYSIPSDKLIVGSFLKDGIGFKEGRKPKKIKNPQMLIKSLSDIRIKDKIFVILSGPARGYVKENLKKNGVDYFHKNCLSKKDLSLLYNLVDVTVINSNLEGGPYSLLESLSSGVPVISTKVGLSKEIIQNYKNGYLIKKNDINALTLKINSLIKKPDLLKKLKRNSRKTVKQFSYKKIGKKFKNNFYKF